MDPHLRANSDALMPNGWKKMDEEKFKLSKEEEEFGLQSIIDEAKTIAIGSVSDLLETIGVGPEDYNLIYDVPIGVIDSIEDGKIKPGIYGIFLGRQSDSIKDCMEDSRKNAVGYLATSIAHEMFHLIQICKDKEYYKTERGKELAYGTVGSFFEMEGLEEGMAELLARLATMIAYNKGNFEDLTSRIEDRCRQERELLTVGLSARIIRTDTGRDLLKWWLTCGQDGRYKEENKLKEIFSDEYEVFRENMNKLYILETKLDDEKTREDLDRKIKLFEETELIIDRHLN